MDRTQLGVFIDGHPIECGLMLHISGQANLHLLLLAALALDNIKATPVLIWSIIMNFII